MRVNWTYNPTQVIVSCISYHCILKGGFYHYYHNIAIQVYAYNNYINPQNNLLFVHKARINIFKKQSFNTQPFILMRV